MARIKRGSRPRRETVPKRAAPNGWEFELGAKVRIVISLETGTVLGRAEYRPEYGAHRYWVNYRDGNSCSKDGWFYPGELAAG